MTRFAAARLDEIEEISDGRSLSRPVRLHFGITSFGVNAWVGRDAGDRIITEHDEGELGEGQEELYLVQRGRARFELDGEPIDIPSTPGCSTTWRAARASRDKPLTRSSTSGSRSSARIGFAHSPRATPTSIRSVRTQLSRRSWSKEQS